MGPKEDFTTADSKKPSKEQGDALKDGLPKPIGRPRVTHCKRRNICNIISNRFAKQARPLPNNEIDEYYISSTFSWLNFEINKEIERTSDEIMEDLNDWSRKDYSDYDCFVLFLLSHGDDKRRVQGFDLEFVTIDSIIDKFVGDRTHKSLRSIPKLLFIQTCRGETHMQALRAEEEEPAEEEEFMRANAKVVPKAQKADMFIFYSTTQGNVAHLGSVRGSFFIHILCQVLQEYCTDAHLHLGDVVTKVNELLAKYVVRTQKGNALVQVSEVVHSLTSDVHFHPKGTYEEFMLTYKHST